MSTVFGWQLDTMPTFPAAPKSIEWKLADTVGINRSPFSLQVQTFNWNAALLRASVSYQPMTDAQFRPWIAFLAGLQGMGHVFMFGDPLHTGPANGGASGGSVTGSNQTGYTLITSSSGLTAGDWIQIGVRLYMVTSVSGGTLGVWPQIRESPAGGSSLVINNCQGLFRLSKNDRGYNVNDNKIYGLVVEIEEAI